MSTPTKADMEAETSEFPDPDIRDLPRGPLTNRELEHVWLNIHTLSYTSESMQLKLIFEWVKTDHISRIQFELLIKYHYMYRNDETT